MSTRFVFAALAALTLASPAFAANATHPYQNIDKRTDAGNDTGDSQVDRLNRAQLDENYYQNRPAQPGPMVGAPPAQPYYNR